MRKLGMTGLALIAATTTMLAASAAAGAKTSFQRVFEFGVGPFANSALVRTGDGNLHILYQTMAGGSIAPSGLGITTVTPAGQLSAPVQAVPLGWSTALPGLTVLPNNTLLAAYGATSPAPANLSGLWTSVSTDGGATWSAPAQTPTSVVHAYGANLSAQTLNGTPVLSFAVAGGIATQQGIAANAPASLLVDNTDDSAADINSALDASGAVIVSWASNAGSGGDYVREAAPQLGAVVKAPGMWKNELQLAAGHGSGVYAPYTPDGKHVRLFRYGGGSVAVGMLKGVTPAALGVASSVAGRVWVMWGDDTGVAVTRSNKAITRFEPIQHLIPGAASLYRVYGDGQLGPLDLLVDQIPLSDIHEPGGFYARVLALLTVTDSVVAQHNKKGAVTGYKVTVHVSDAGDNVAGATVQLGSSSKATSTGGIAHFTLGAGASAPHLSVTMATYRKYSAQLKL